MEIDNIFREMDSDPRFVSLQKEAEKIGAKVYLISLSVGSRRSFSESAMAGGPQTNTNYSVFKIAHLYKTEESKEEQRDVLLILINWPNGKGGFKKASDFAFLNGLRRTTPYVVFAMGELYTELNKALEIPLPLMTVIETTGYIASDGKKSACYVIWDDHGRKAGTSWQRSMGRKFDHFAYEVKW